MSVVPWYPTTDLDNLKLVLKISESVSILLALQPRTMRPHPGIIGMLRQIHTPPGDDRTKKTYVNLNKQQSRTTEKIHALLDDDRAERAYINLRKQFRRINTQSQE